VANDLQGPKVGLWYLLNGEWGRVTAIGRRFATLIGRRGRRYVPLAELVDLEPQDRDPPPPAAA
jgi:hypothetical protein